jgi:hypothetical protein
MGVHNVIRRGAVAAAVAGALLATPMVASASLRAVAPHVPPATPAAVTLTAGNKSMAVTWSESSSGTINFVATARAPGRAVRVCKVKKDSCTIAALVNGVVYGVSVVAKNASGASAPSGAVTAIVGVPGPPTAVHAAAETSAAAVAWGAPAASGVAKVALFMATASPGGYSCSTATTVVSAAGHTCQIAGLTSGVTYTITVTATNAFGTSVPSKPTTVTAG